MEETTYEIDDNLLTILSTTATDQLLVSYQHVLTLLDKLGNSAVDAELLTALSGDEVTNEMVNAYTTDYLKRAGRTMLVSRGISLYEEACLTLVISALSTLVSLELLDPDLAEPILNTLEDADTSTEDKFISLVVDQNNTSVSEIIEGLEYVTPTFIDNLLALFAPKVAAAESEELAETVSNDTKEIHILTDNLVGTENSVIFRLYVAGELDLDDMHKYDYVLTDILDSDDVDYNLVSLEAACLSYLFRGDLTPMEVFMRQILEVTLMDYDMGTIDNISKATKTFLNTIISNANKLEQE